MFKWLKNSIVYYLLGCALYLIGVLLWNYIWGYNLANSLMMFAYLIFILIIPGCFISYLILNKNKDGITLISGGLIIGFLLMLTDYFLSIFIFSPRFTGITILGVYLFGFVYFFVKYIKGIKPLFGLRINLQKIKSLNIYSIGFVSLFTICIYIFFTIIRPSPTISLTYDTDFLWHAGNVNVLTQHFPAVSPNMAYSIPIRYHHLVHILAAHIANIFKLHPSMVFLNDMFVIIAFLTIFSILLLLLRLNINNFVILIGILLILFGTGFYINWESRAIINSESYALGLILFFIILSLFKNEYLFYKKSFSMIFLIAVGLGLLTAAKSSAGVIFLFTLGLFNIIYFIIDKEKISKYIFMKGLIIIAIWSIFYSVFFCGSKWPVKFGLFTEFDKYNAYSFWINDFLVQLKLQLSSSQNILIKNIPIIFNPLLYCIIRILSIFHFLFISLNWRLLGILPLFFLKDLSAKREILFFSMIMIVSLIFTISLAIPLGSIFYFWFYGLAAMSILFTKAINYTIEKCSSKFVKFASVLLVVLIVSNIVVSYGDPVFKPISNNILLNSYCSGSCRVDKTLYDSLIFIRDNVPKNYYVLHKFISNRNSFAISALSEHPSYLENLEYATGGKIEDILSLYDFTVKNGLGKTRSLQNEIMGFSEKYNKKSRYISSINKYKKYIINNKNKYDAIIDENERKFEIRKLSRYKRVINKYSYSLEEYEKNFKKYGDIINSINKIDFNTFLNDPFYINLCKEYYNSKEVINDIFTLNISTKVLNLISERNIVILGDNKTMTDLCINFPKLFQNIYSNAVYSVAKSNKVSANELKTKKKDNGLMYK